MEYRSDPRGEIWHFCRSCSKWPDKLYATLWLDKPPKVLKVCPECQAVTSTVAFTYIASRSPPLRKPWFTAAPKCLHWVSPPPSIRVNVSHFSMMMGPHCRVAKRAALVGGLTGTS